MIMRRAVSRFPIPISRIIRRQSDRWICRPAVDRFESTRANLSKLELPVVNAEFPRCSTMTINDLSVSPRTTSSRLRMKGPKAKGSSPMMRLQSM